MGKGNIYLWTGDGAGKTTSALGVTLRAVAHNRKVIIIQFMKGRKNIGEYLIKKRLGKNYEIHQFGRKGWVNTKNPSEFDKMLARKALHFANTVVREDKPFLLILDEINLALSIGLLNIKDVMRFLNSVPSTTNVYLIGRNAPYELRNRADFVNEIILVKQPRFFKAKKGIDF
jgi:cob(I)alamin adenosyltransferase